MEDYETEEDIKQRYITPAIKSSQWDSFQIKMEHIAPGEIHIKGRKTKRGNPLKVDYILAQKVTNRPLAVVEAKDKKHSLGSGMQQAVNYAQKLDVPFAFSSNGTGFLEHDFLTGHERELSLESFPTEAELWQRYTANKGISPEIEKVITEPYNFDQFTNREPRYYQRIAIDRTIEAVAKGQNRLLLVMATGTGKTFTAFQIVWRLLKSKAVKRVLYLADRNVLIEQTIRGDFQPLGNSVVKVHRQKDERLDSSYEVYMSLYHQLAGEPGDEPFRDFAPDFFDLVIVDECHRGSAREDSQWRRILDYFHNAIHLGMTATPKETKEVSNITYFGDPIYTYSLKEGIEDGFLAPYKVIRVGLNVDLENWRPYEGQTDTEGELVEDREYNVRDFDKNLIIDERTKAVAKYVTAWLERFGADSKTIVFCVDIEHAERMRQALVNENAERVKANSRYIMRITGDDDYGKSQLDNFADPNEKYPTVVTTSKLLTTGVDIRTVKLIVLESNINSMTEFKQIIGRGTRIDEEHGKEFFTIMDFRASTRLFSDPDFDGEPVVIINLPPPGEDKIGGLEVPPNWPGDSEDEESEGSDGDWEDDNDGDGEDSGSHGPLRKVRVNGVDVRLLNKLVQYIDPKTGKLLTETVRDFSKRSIRGRFETLDSFIHAWSEAERKSAILEELENQGVFLDSVREEAGAEVANLDDFDLILHIAFDRPPLTKKERIDNVKKRGYLHKYSADCQAVLSALLDKYSDVGIGELENTRVLDNEPFTRFGSPTKIANLFGGREAYLDAVRGLERELYAA